MSRGVVAGAILFVALASPSTAADRGVAIPGKLFEPERLEVLVGDTVTWTNLDAVTHTATADDRSFDSGDLPPDGVFSLTFDRAGRIVYHCTIHRFMTGEVDVFALALSGPLDPVPVGAHFALRGLAPSDSRTVSVERRAPDGTFVPEATANVAGDGSFRLSVPAVTSMDYRAVSGALVSPPVHVRVSPRVMLRVRRAGRVVRMDGLAVPAQPGMPVALEVYSRERFDWFPYRAARLDARSRIRFILSPRRKLRLRLVVLHASAGLVRGTSNVVVAAPPRPSRRALAKQNGFEVREYTVPEGSHPHDVAPARDGGVWYTAQHSGELGWLDPKTGRVRHTSLGPGSAPHGVIVGPDGAPWITDGGLNAIVRVDPRTLRVRRFPLPGGGGYANLNTATFDRRGVLWFTGQSGIYGRLDPKVGRVRVFTAPRGPGPYGIATAPGGAVYYASLAGSYVGRIDIRSGKVAVLRPPTRGQGARRVWSDSRGRIWVSEWNAGRVARYEPATRRWREWRLPGSNPQPYAIYVDQRDVVWLTDFSANALVRFDPRTQRFTTIRLPSSPANVRQLLGRPGEIWGAESGVDKLVVVRPR